MSLIPSLSNAECVIVRQGMAKKLLHTPFLHKLTTCSVQNSRFCSAKEKAYIQVGMENHVFTH